MPGTSRETMRRWQAGWEGMDQRIEPMMVPLADRAAIVWTCGPDWATMTVPADREVGMDVELITEASTTGWSPTTQPRNGPSQRPPTPVSTPTPSPNSSSATEQQNG